MPHAENKNPEPVCAGFIQLVFCDPHSNESIPLGGAAFPSVKEWTVAWSAIPESEDQGTLFMADCLGADRDIVGDKRVSGAVCAALMGQPLSELVSKGKAQVVIDHARFFSRLQP